MLLVLKACKLRLAGVTCYFMNVGTLFHYVMSALVVVCFVIICVVSSIITSYLYVEKIVKCGLPLTRRNIRSVVFIAMLLASKVWDDMSMWNVDFAGIFAALTLSRINDWEGAFLTGIQFNVVVKASEYTAMYFKIREYHHQAKLQMAPLRKERAQRLEALSETALKKLKIKSASKKNRSQTLGCTDMPSSQAILS